MKKLLLTLVLGAAFTFAAQGQNGLIPNGGFEGGVVGTNNITGWTTVNDVTLQDTQTFNITGGGTKVVTASQGTKFVRLQTDTVNVGGQTFAAIAAATTRIAYSTKPDSILFDAMYLPTGQNDQLSIRLNFTKWNTTTNLRDTVVKNYSINGPAATQIIDVNGDGWAGLKATFTSLTIPSAFDSISVTVRSAAANQANYGVGTTAWYDNIRLYQGPVTDIQETVVTFSNDFSVYPNPFTTTTNIRYTLSQNEMVNLQVFDAQGRLVSTLVNENQAAGQHQVQFDGTNLEPGMYFYRLNAGDAIRTERMILAK